MDNNDNNINNNINFVNNENKEIETGNIYQEILNKLNNSKTNFNNDSVKVNKKEEKNFSQQVDFLYHKNNPEGQSSIKNIIIKQYKKHNNNEDKKENKKKKNKSLSPKRLIPYANKNKGLFDPYLSQKELDYESNIEKQRAERQKKIDEYEKNINKKKLKKNLDKKILNFSKPNIKPAKIKKNYLKENKNKKNEEIKNFIQMPKPKIQKTFTKNFGFHPKKYDMIINSLVDQINLGGKNNKNNIGKKIKNYAKNNIDKYNNYYEYVYKNNINNIQQNKKRTINNNLPKPTRAQIIKGLMQKYFGPENNKQNYHEISKKNENKNIVIKSNKKKEKENSEDNLLLNIETDIKNNNEINFDNIDKLLASNKINFQDKINIISELNKNIDKYSQAMPVIINQVQNSLNEIYKNNIIDINFRKEVNKIPYIAMASKTAYQIIQTNMDIIIEKTIDELLDEFALEMQNIKKQREYLIKKFELVNEFNETKNKLNDITEKEKNVFDENIKFIEDKKNIVDNICDKNEENKIVIKKYVANLDESMIKRNDKYKNDFKEYMVFKGEFYADNIFNIYDEFIEEESNEILNKLVDKFFEKLNI